MAEITLNDEELQLVTELLDSRIGELHPTIRRSRVYHVTDSLKHDMETLQALAKRFHEAKSVIGS